MGQLNSHIAPKPTNLDTALDTDSTTMIIPVVGHWARPLLHPLHLPEKDVRTKALNVHLSSTYSPGKVLLGLGLPTVTGLLRFCMLFNLRHRKGHFL